MGNSYLYDMKNLLYVAAGGAIGAVLRYLVNLAFKPDSDAAFPIHTFIINTVGCLLIGFVFAFILKNSGHHLMQYFIITGLLGGFTTFSSYTMESVYLFDQSRAVRAVLYIMLSNACGIGAAWFGYNFHKLAG
jgi:fluoride exporter